MMEVYISLAAGMILMPLIYWGAMMIYRMSFREEKNRERVPLHSVFEIIVLLSAEAAIIGIWRAEVWNHSSPMMFQLLFVVLTGMTVFCMTDYWERVVPNRLLLILLFLFFIIVGIQGVRDMEVVLDVVPSILMGFLFCGISFGLGYLLSHKNMGAGDVKLALVMGLYLTGKYVVGAILYGCIAAAVFSVIQLARKKLKRKDTIPFVPFLYLGLVIRCLAG